MKIFYALVAGAVLFSSIGTLLNFQRFLSGHIDVSKQAHQALARKETNYFVTKTVFWDLGLLIMFILQHSLMANHRWKNLLNNTLGLSVVERSIYVGASCLALQALMHQWVPVFSGTAWLVDVSSRQGNQLYSLLFFAVHVVAWVLTLGSLLLMDILELGGVKQVYFYCIGLNPPITYKHHSLARIYAHNRHPCALGPLLILWAVPVMRLDRLILAFVYTIYLLLGQRLDAHDCSYLRTQYGHKWVEVSYQQEVRRTRSMAKQN